MGSFSFWHILILAIIVLLLFGGNRFSAMMGDVAKGLKSFKQGMADDEDEKRQRYEEQRRLDTRPIDVTPEPRRTTDSGRDPCSCKPTIESCPCAAGGAAAVFPPVVGRLGPGGAAGVLSACGVAASNGRRVSTRMRLDVLVLPLVRTFCTRPSSSSSKRTETRPGLPDALVAAAR